MPSQTWTLTAASSTTSATGMDEIQQRVRTLARSLSALFLYDRHGLYLFADGVRLDLTYKPRRAFRGQFVVWR
jgi:hypothetical protein